MLKFLPFLILFIAFDLNAQMAIGSVSNSDGEKLVGANVYWANTSQGVTTNKKGDFKLSFPKELELESNTIIASFVGYKPDSVDVKGNCLVNFVLKPAEELEEIIIAGEREGVIISSINTIKTEQITQTELAKAACCDLAGCFNTQTTVKSQTTNVITNSKELRILGLSGVYNQVLIDGFPLIQGLSYTYGISSIPGTLVQNIYVSKGSNSVLQGFESISGQINVLTTDPSKADRLFINGYINSFLEKHLNVQYTFKKKNWSSVSAFHMVQPASKFDRDKDYFLDLPLLSRYMFFNKWKFGEENQKGWFSSIGLRFLNEKRIGGQTDFNSNTDGGSSNVYGQSVKFNQPDLWMKFGHNFNSNHSLSFFTSAFYQNQNSFFGTVQYEAKQANFYFNSQYQLVYKKHDFKTGFSFRYLNLKEEIAFTNQDLSRNFAGDYHKIEQVPGLFAENTIRLLDNKFTWIAGLRADHHNQYGVIFTPRTLIKYDITPRSIFRANFGKGWRTANLFSENINLLVSSRDIIFEEELQPEEALNFGFNFTQKFGADKVSGHVSTDFYRTQFQNQIFPDYDSQVSTAIIKNFKDKSIGNGFQIEFLLKLFKQLEIKAGYNYLDVYREINGKKQLLPFNSKHTVLYALNYKPKSNKFHIDLNMHWYGKQRLPNTDHNPVEFQRPDFSRTYAVLNTQFTYYYKAFEFYTGCENIFDFRQKQPIISWEDPFGPYFDTSSVWGQTRGREIYVGFRYRLKSKGAK